MHRSILLASLALVAIGIASCDTARGADDGERLASPWVATAVGRIDAEDEARHLVASVDGVIDAVFVDRGDRVAAGQALMRIDCAPRQAAMRSGMAATLQAERAAQTIGSGTAADRAAILAEIDSATARLVHEDAQLRRAEAILERGFVARSAYDERVQARVAARSALRAAEARLADLEHGRRPAENAEALAAAATVRREAEAAAALAQQCMVRSPVSGQVLQILRREGEHSGATQGIPLIVVGDLSRLIVRAEVMEQDAAAVSVGQRAQVWIDGSGKRWAGRVTHVSGLMGRRSARSLDPTDRFDRDVREVFVTLDDGSAPPLVGLRVTVGLQ